MIKKQDILDFIKGLDKSNEKLAITLISDFSIKGEDVAKIRATFDRTKMLVEILLRFVDMYDDGSEDEGKT